MSMMLWRWEQNNFTMKLVRAHHRLSNSTLDSSLTA